MNLGDTAVGGHVEKTAGSGVLCVGARPRRRGMRVRKRMRAGMRTEAPRNPRPRARLRMRCPAPHFWPSERPVAARPRPLHPRVRAAAPCDPRGAP